MPARPSGTLTFLFTDVVGSTRRWDAEPEAMKHALARLDGVLRRVSRSGSETRSTWQLRRWGGRS